MYFIMKSSISRTMLIFFRQGFFFQPSCFICLKFLPEMIGSSFHLTTKSILESKFTVENQRTSIFSAKLEKMTKTAEKTKGPTMQVDLMLR